MDHIGSNAKRAADLQDSLEARSAEVERRIAAGEIISAAQTREVIPTAMNTPTATYDIGSRS